MTEQPEALFLADELEAPLGTVISGEVDKRAAAELRRLHEENERLHQINQWHEMKLSVRGYVIQVDDLKAANAELLEALTMVRDADDDCRKDGLREIPPPARATIDAAIAKAEDK